MEVVPGVQLHSGCVVVDHTVVQIIVAERNVHGFALPAARVKGEVDVGAVDAVVSDSPQCTVDHIS